MKKLLPLVLALYAAVSEGACEWAVSSIDASSYEESIIGEIPQFIAISKQDITLTSADAVNWTIHSKKQPLDVMSVDWSRIVFVSSGANGGGDAWGPLVVSSDDGMSWSTQRVSSIYPLYDQTMHKGNFVVVGLWGYSAVSTDGHTWVFAPGIQSTHLLGAVSDGAKIVGIGNPAVAYHSTDGLHWTSKSSQDGYIRELAWSGHEYIAVGRQGKVYQSFDGVAWSRNDIETAEDLRYVVWNGKEFVTISESGTVFRSPCNVKSYASNALEGGGGHFGIGLVLFLLGGWLMRILCVMAQPTLPPDAAAFRRLSR